MNGLSAFTSLPTDSLYKFVALSGLFIAMTSAFAPIYFARSLRSAVDASELKIALCETKSTYLKDDLSSFKSRIGLPENFNPLDLPSDQMLERLSQVDLTSLGGVRPAFDALEDFKAKSLSLELELVEAQHQADRMERLLGELRFLRILMAVGVFTGAVMATTGFRLWYFKIQVYLDQAVSGLL